MSLSSTLATRKNRLVIAATLAALGAVSIGVFSALSAPAPVQANPSPAATAPAAAPVATPVAVAEVLQQQVTHWQAYSGRLEAVDRVELRPRVAGTVAALHFREGSLVNKGDLLVTIDPAPYAAEVARLQAQFSAAQARAAHSAREAQRAQTLWDERAIAQREFDDRVNAQRVAQAEVAAAQAALQAAQLQLGYTQVRAPISGRIGRIEVTAGNQVGAGPSAPVLTTLVSVNPIYASFDADEKTVRGALAQMQQGPAGQRTPTASIPVQMSLEGGAAALDGRLQLIDNQVDASSGTVRLRAVFDNRDGRLMPGQFAKLQLGQARQQNALLINERAVQTDQDKRFVWVVGADNKVVWREVTLGAPVDGLREVTGGLAAGERIVLSGLQRVRPGALVAPQPVAMNAKPEVLARTDGPIAAAKPSS